MRMKNLGQPVPSKVYNFRAIFLKYSEVVSFIIFRRMSLRKVGLCLFIWGICEKFNPRKSFVYLAKNNWQNFDEHYDKQVILSQICTKFWYKTADAPKERRQNFF